MRDWRVRLETVRDIGAVRSLNDAAFGTTVEGSLVDAVRGVRGSISLVATLADGVVGHILFTPVTLNPSGGKIAGLGPMAVHPDHQRHGIGSQLVRAGLDRCRLDGYDAVVVVGHPAYYPRFGFLPARTRGLRCEFAVPDDAFMVLELTPNAVAKGGTVRYLPEFAMAADAEGD